MQIPELIDMVLDNFIHKSVSSGLGSPQVEIMADTAGNFTKSTWKINKY